MVPASGRNDEDCEQQKAEQDKSEIRIRPVSGQEDFSVYRQRCGVQKHSLKK